MAAVRVAATEWQLVAEQLAAALGRDRRTADQAHAVLLAPVGGEPSAAAAVWSQAVQDHGAILSHGVGEPPSGVDCSDERSRGRKSFAGMGRKRGSIGLWHSQKWQTRPFSWALEAPNAEDSPGHCMEMRSGVCYGSTGKPKRKPRLEATPLERAYFPIPDLLRRRRRRRRLLLLLALHHRVQQIAQGIGRLRLLLVLLLNIRGRRLLLLVLLVRLRSLWSRAFKPGMAWTHINYPTGMTVGCGSGPSLIRSS